MGNFVLILALGVIIILALVVMVSRFTRKEVRVVEERLKEGSTTHRFVPGHAFVERAVTIEAPAQHHAGTQREVRVEAASLPDLRGATPPAGKAIDGVIAVIVNPIVRFTDSGDEVYQFEPPLDLTVEYTEADVRATTLDAQGIPLISLAVVSQDGAVWKWERLKTRVNPSAPAGAGTLHAKIHTLHPKDPIIMCYP